MSEIVKTFLLTPDEFVPKMHLRQPAIPGKPGSTYSVCESFTKNQEKIPTQKKQKIQGVFIKTNQIKLAFSMINFDFSQRNAPNVV